MSSSNYEFGPLKYLFSLMKHTHYSSIDLYFIQMSTEKVLCIVHFNRELYKNFIELFFCRLKLLCSNFPKHFSSDVFSSRLKFLWYLTLRLNWQSQKKSGKKSQDTYFLGTSGKLEILPQDFLFPGIFFKQLF